MDLDLPTPGSRAEAVGATFRLGPLVRLVTDASPDVVGVAVLAAGRLGCELDTGVVVVHEPDGATPSPPDVLGTRDGPDASDPLGAGTVRLRLATAAELGLPDDPTAHDQGYRLVVRPDGADLAAVTPTGLTHAVASLVRLAEASRTSADRAARRPARLPVMTLVDHPWVAWRGLGVDLATEPLGVDGLRTVLGVMSALRLGVLRLPRLDLAELGPGGYGEVAAAAAARRVLLVPGATGLAGPSSVGDLVAATRAPWVDVGGRRDDGDDVRRRVDAAAAAGAGALVDQASADAVVGVPGVVVVVRDAADDVAAVRRAVEGGATVLLAPVRHATEQPLVHAAVAVDRALATLDLPDGALRGVEAGPGTGAVAPPPDEEVRAGTLLPWMAAIAEVGWTAPH